MSRLKAKTQKGWPYKGEIVLQEGSAPLVLGRTPDLAIPAHETTISRNHCEVSVAEDGGVKIRPLKKVWILKNGCQLEEARAKGPTVLVRSCSPELAIQTSAIYIAVA